MIAWGRGRARPTARRRVSRLGRLHGGIEMKKSNPASAGRSRRKVLGAAASVGALAASGTLFTPAIAQGKKLTYWGGLIFSDDANKLLTDTINAWGAANGVETEVVMINQN